MLCLLRNQAGTKAKRGIAPLTLFLLLVGSVMAYADDAERETSRESGRDIGIDFTNKYGSEDSITDNVINPLVSDTPMQPVGQSMYQCSTTSKTYKTQADCANACTTGTCIAGFKSQITSISSKAFFTLTLGVGATGDVTSVQIEHDTDFDGTADLNYTLNPTISGICANGYIQCQPGTWNSCTSYAWTVGADKKVSGKAMTASLSGCYCINNSCGVGIAANGMESILDDIGGSIANTIQQGSYDSVITKVENLASASKIRFYGGKTTSTPKNGMNSQSPYQSGTDSPGAYYGDAALVSGGSSAYAAEQSRPDSASYIVTHSAYAVKKTTAERTCTITNTPYYTTAWTDHYCKTQADKAFQSCSTSQYGNQDASVDQCGGNAMPQGIGATAVAQNRWQESFWCGKNTICYGCHDTIWYHWRTGIDTPHVTTTNNCTNLDNCSIREEKVCDNDGKCVYTMKNGVLTGLKPTPNCRPLASEMQYYTVCTDGAAITSTSSGTAITSTPVPGSTTTTLASGGTDAIPLWWSVTRKYQCVTDTGNFDMTEIKKRSVAVNTSAKGNKGSGNSMSLNYNDYANGTTTAKSSNLGTWKESTITCEQACTVREKNTTAIQANNTSRIDQLQNEVTTTNDLVRPCRLVSGSDDKWTCPVDLAAGESLIKDCSCASSFGKAAGLLEMVNQAGKDMICSED